MSQTDPNSVSIGSAPTPVRTNARTPSARKLGWIAAIAFATTIPSVLISQLVDEREDRATAARQDIVSAWGPEQRVGGPMLVVPVTEKDGAKHYIAVAPRALDVHAVLAPSSRRRGLFATTVYDATVAMVGTFALPEAFRDGGPDKPKATARRHGAHAYDVTPQGAFIVLGISGQQGVRNDDHADVAGVTVPWQTCADAAPDDAGCRSNAGVLVAGVKSSAIHGGDIPFDLTLHLRGTGTLLIATAAKQALARIDGAWPTPRFVGTILPNASTTTASGFESAWTLDQIGQPKSVKATSLAGLDEGDPTIGVDLIEATPVYRTITRVTKYALLIVTLAFATYVLLELVTGVPVALSQYAMLGASLSLFSLLLLSVSEIVGYTSGYTLSAVLVTVQASVYTRAVARRTRPAAVFAAMLTTVFGFFYVLVGLETYSLVIGATALFIVLSIIMGLTQTITSADETSASRTIGSGDVVLGGER